MKFDDLLVKYLGDFGRYQLIQFSLLCLPIIFTAIHSLSWTFVASPLPHRYFNLILQIDDL
ncbi:unnamed protein product [Dracunculus medinensis]|uniref:ABC transporter permease n=1 Tax=Dracunculus medinensis TaxID=318479 RepID=A0A0N4UQ86_DRAME|nr:unnamed protein product [Dracunculus medinensis]